MIRQAVILAGGLGTRLGDLTKTTPKPMVEVAGRPFLEHLVTHLARFGIDDLVLSTGYLAEQFSSHFGDGARLGVRLRTVVEPSPMGTGGALRFARAALDETFLLLNGDTLFDLNFLDLALELDERTLAAIALRRVPDAGRYGRVHLDGDRVASFAEKSGEAEGLINGGVYVMRRAIVDRLREGSSSLERDLFPTLAAERRLRAKAYDGFFIDIGVPDSLAEARAKVPEWLARPALLLDRDGTINVDHGWVHRPEQLDWIEGAVEAIKLANDRHMPVVVITNQAGIAKGLYDEAAFWSFMAHMKRELRARGAHLDAIYFCPHHPEGKGALGVDCECRKPKPGMILRAIAELGFDPARSVMIGDKDWDVEAAERAGVRGLLFTGGSLLSCVERARSGR